MKDCEKYNNCIGCPNLKEIEDGDEKLFICGDMIEKEPIQYDPGPGPDDVIVWNMDDLYDLLEE